MTTRIWLEPLKRPDGRNWYTDRGLLLRARLGGPDGEVLCSELFCGPKGQSQLSSRPYGAQRLGAMFKATPASPAPLWTACAKSTSWHVVGISSQLTGMQCRVASDAKPADIASFRPYALHAALVVSLWSVVGRLKLALFLQRQPAGSVVENLSSNCEQPAAGPEEQDTPAKDRSRTMGPVREAVERTALPGAPRPPGQQGGNRADHQGRTPSVPVGQRQ